LERAKKAELIAELIKSREEESALWDEAHRLIWRIGKQEALEAEMKEIRANLERWRAELDQLRRRLAELEDELRRERDRKPGDDPSNPGQRFPWWPWVIASFGIWALIAALWEWLRRRRAGSGLGLPA